MPFRLISSTFFRAGFDFRKTPITFSFMYLNDSLLRRLKPNEVYEFRVFVYCDGCVTATSDDSYLLLGKEFLPILFKDIIPTLPKSVHEVFIYLYTTRVLKNITVPYSELISHLYV